VPHSLRSRVDPLSSEKRALLFIFITILVDVIGIAVIIPVIPELIGNLKDVSTGEAAAIGGWMMVAYSVMQFFFAPVMGELSDRFGRRPLLLIALFGLGCDYLFHAYAPTLTWLFIGRIIAGVAGSSFTVATAYIADISTKENKAKNFGLVGAAFGLGFIIGPVIGGLFGEWYGFRAPFFVAASLTLLNFLYGLLFIPESLPSEKRRPIKLTNMIPGVSLGNLSKYKAFGGLILAFFLANLAGQALPSTWSFFTIERLGFSEIDIGISLAVVGFLVAIVQAGLIGTVVKKFGQKRTIMGGFVLWSIGMFLFSIAGSTIALYLFLIPYVLGGVAGPTLQGLLSNNVSPSEQGNLQGALTSMVSVSAIIGPLMCTQVFNFTTAENTAFYYPGSPFALGAVLLLSGTAIAYFSLRKLGAEFISDQS
jgi:MFS transporter, DHA1 family, tetracycline resistance protein